MTCSAGSIGGRERLAGLLLGLGSMAAFGVSWQFLAAAAVVELIRLGRRIGSLALPLGGVFLCLFVLSRVFLSPEQDSRGWTVGLLGLLSYLVAYTLSSDGWERCRLAVLGIVAGSTAHAVLNLGIIVSDHGLVPSTRLFDDVWTGAVWTATGHATLWVPVVGSVPYFLFVGKKRATVVGWVLLGLSLWAAAVLASRTLLGLIVVSLLLGATVVLTRRGRFSRLLAAVGPAAILALVAYFTLSRRFIDSLPLVSRLASGQLDLRDDPRLDRWPHYLNHMWDSPDGGRELQKSQGYAHNLWLDSFDADGAIPFLLLVLFSVTFIAGLVGISKRLPPSTGGMVLLVAVGVTWMIQAATEPLIDLAPYFFAAGCGFAGATAGVLRALRREGPRESEGVHADTASSLGKA